MMAVTFSSVVDPKEETLGKAFVKYDGRQVLKQDFKIFIVDGRNRIQALLTFRTEDGPQWT